MAYVFEALPADRSRIDLSDPMEIRYWAGKFECSEEQLKRIVARVGSGAARVERILDGVEELPES
ncbi:DUF3606 domain-containing protein [Ramlibacter sp.]|uniref:DUF3606 domain-containing protein n=1 Tax=Ramlibacter sp. TaxID=1917967 RepID=UPI003D12E78D